LVLRHFPAAAGQQQRQAHGGEQSTSPRCVPLATEYFFRFHNSNHPVRMRLRIHAPASRPAKRPAAPGIQPQGAVDIKETAQSGSTTANKIPKPRKVKTAR